LYCHECRSRAAPERRSKVDGQVNRKMLREAEINRLQKALRTERKRPGSWPSTVAWEVARVAGLLGKYFKTLRNEG
jgi:hypothetical protein